MLKKVLIVKVEDGWQIYWGGYFLGHYETKQGAVKAAEKVGEIVHIKA